MNSAANNSPISSQYPFTPLHLKWITRSQLSFYFVKGLTKLGHPSQNL